MMKKQGHDSEAKLKELFKTDFQAGDSPVFCLPCAVFFFFLCGGWEGGLGFIMFQQKRLQSEEQ